MLWVLCQGKKVKLETKNILKQCCHDIKKVIFKITKSFFLECGQWVLCEICGSYFSSWWELLVTFPLIFLVSHLHNESIQVIDLPKQSEIEAETGYSSSFCTLSVDSRENKGLRCVQNKEMGRHNPSLKEGCGRGESFTHPQGRSQSLTSDLSLKEGNLGEGERNMSEQSEKLRSKRTKPRHKQHAMYVRVGSSDNNDNKPLKTLHFTRCYMKSNMTDFLALRFFCLSLQLASTLSHEHLSDADLSLHLPGATPEVCSRLLFFTFLL